MTDALSHVTEFEVTSGRKLQLERYEPIEEQATLAGEFPEDATPEEKREILDEVNQEARDQCERALMRRYEENVREDDIEE